MQRQRQLAGKRLVRNSSRHMTLEDVAAFLSPQRSAKDRKMYIEHLAQCSRCRKLLARLIQSEGFVRRAE